MSDAPDPTEFSPENASAKGTGVSRWRVPRLPVLIGVVGLGAMVTTGTFVKRRADSREVAEIAAVRSVVEEKLAAAEAYRLKLASLRWTAAKLETNASAASEPLKSWARERALRFAGLVSAIEEPRRAAADLIAREAAEIEELCRRGKAREAQSRLARLPTLKFPEAQEFRALHAKEYLEPLVRFSRQNPDYYRALHEHEPEAADADRAALREQLAKLGLDVLTPQAMVGFELLSAVATRDDPLLADWETVVSAGDFFDEPDAATLAAWRRAQQAVRAGEWQTAVAGMQSILRTKVRTRQPFRAAYGRALLKNSPDDSAAAYPFLLEAAQAGDKEARGWVSQEDLARGRYESALRWFEARVMDGEREAVTPLLSIYAQPAEAVARDCERELGLLQRIVTAPDAPPLAWMLLARFYETGEAGTKSAAQAFVCYQRAAERGHVAAWAELARCHLRGIGARRDAERARDWATRAFAAGERERSLPLLIELMQQAPERTADAVLHLIEHEQVAAPAGFADTRIQANGIAKLQRAVAQHFDERGRFGDAARVYAKFSASSPEAAARLSELTTARECDFCFGKGEVETSAACPTCSGKGTLLCSACDGRGYNFVPGTPPCTTCGGSGAMAQDGRAVSCLACEGSGKGKGSVIKQPCGGCASGRMACRACTGGRLKITKSCTACRGAGTRSLADG